MDRHLGEGEVRWPALDCVSEDACKREQAEAHVDLVVDLQ